MKKLATLLLATAMLSSTAYAETWMDRQKFLPDSQRVEVSQNLILLGTVLTIGGAIMHKQAGDIKSRGRASKPEMSGKEASDHSWYAFGGTITGVAGILCLGVGIRLRF
jgi:hypothetical protein